MSSNYHLLTLTELQNYTGNQVMLVEAYGEHDLNKSPCFVWFKN